jgi:ATP synthase F1 gamma subunit
MKRPNEIQRQAAAMNTLVELTSAFEGIASMRIAQIKDQVLHSTIFFNHLWSIYRQLRVESTFGFGRDKSIDVIDKELYIIITGEGGFSGDIDEKLLELMLKDYDASKNAIVVIGHHGAIQLAQRGVIYDKYFKMPVSDKNINTEPLIKQVQRYRSTKVFYQEYISLTVQDVRRIELSNAIEQKGQNNKDKADIISEQTYIFEPSSYDVASHLERSMMQIALSQLILESKLAQYASRFRAMTSASHKASQNKASLQLDYNRARRAVKDERLKEIINGLKKNRAKAAR